MRSDGYAMAMLFYSSSCVVVGEGAGSDFHFEYSCVHIAKLFKQH